MSTLVFRGDYRALTHISDALRSGSYTCPGCKSPLTPVLGENYAKHFRHSEECCTLETYLHKCAKEAFFYRYLRALSHEVPISLELERRVSCNGSRLALVRGETRHCLKFVPARYNLTQFFDQVELEKYDKVTGALFPKSTIKPQLPQPQVTVTLGAF